MEEPRPPQIIIIKKWGWGGRDPNSPNPNFTTKAPARVPPHTRGSPQKGVGSSTIRLAPRLCLRPRPPAAPALAPAPAPAQCLRRSTLGKKQTPKGKSDTSVSHRAKHWKHEIADVDQDHPGSSRSGGGCARALCGAAPGRGRRGCGSRRGGRRSAGRGRRGGGWRGDRWPMERLPSRPLSTFKGAGAAAAATQRRAQPMGAERSAARPRRNRGGQRGPRARRAGEEVTAGGAGGQSRGPLRCGGAGRRGDAGRVEPGAVLGPQRAAPCTYTRAACTRSVHTTGDVLPDMWRCARQRRQAASAHDPKVPGHRTQVTRGRAHRGWRTCKPDCRRK